MSHGAHSAESGTQLEIVRSVPQLERTFFNLKEQLQTSGVGTEAIEMLTPLDIKVSDEGTSKERIHLLIAAEDIDDTGQNFRDIVWYSPATQPPGSEQTTIVLKPGLGEIVEYGIGYKFHEGIGKLNLDKHILTHATEGFGPSATALAIKELPGFSLDRMSERLQRLLRLYCPDQDLILVGTSMGTVVNHKLQVVNKRLPDNEKLHIKGVVNYIPALVDSSKSAITMGLKFPAMMLIDGTLEIGFRTSPKRFFQVIETLRESKPARKDLPLLMRLAGELLVGVSKEEVIENTRTTPTITVTGSLDSLREEDMWEMSEAKFYLLKGRGHGMATKPHQGAIKISTCVSELELAS